MDQAIVDLIATRQTDSKMEINHEAQTLTLIKNDGSSGEALPVKPLTQLYGKGTGADSVDFNDQRFLSLLMAIEEAIYDADKQSRGLTDSAILAALDRLCMNPDTPVSNDPLAHLIQFSLRVTLSLNDFSRQDVRMCLRKVKKSCALHTSTSGIRGYLNFLREQFTRQGA